MKLFPALSSALCLAVSCVAAASTGHAATCKSEVTSYTVASGDTLSRIALTVFGDSDEWALIYEYPGNAESIGRNPNILSIGTALSIPPCPGAVTQLPSELEQRQDAPARAETQTGSGTDANTIYIVTGDDWAPYVDSDWPQGGMGTLLVKAAFDAVGMGDRVRIHNINDWNAQLYDLVPSDRYQLAFGWSMPDMTYWKTCDRVAKPMQIRCKYNQSEPVFTISLGFFSDTSRSDLKDITIEDMKTKRICRPTGWSTFQMEENGIPLENLVGAANPQGCFEKIINGEADFAVVNRPSGIAIATKMGIRDNIEMAPFTVPYAIHLVAYKDNPLNTTAYLDEFNKGLKIIIDNGTYAQISSYFNDEFARRTQENSN